MATTSSNKMPLLVDRPLHAFATIGGTAALTSATDLNTPSSAGCTLLVDCSGNDGAIIDSLSIIANEASTTASNVIVFLSTLVFSIIFIELNLIVNQTRQEKHIGQVN